VLGSCSSSSWERQRFAARVFCLHSTHHQTVSDFHRREAIFGVAESAYNELTVLMREFSPFGRLWIIASEFKHSRESWLAAPVRSLDASLKAMVEGWHAEVIGLHKALRDSPAPLQVSRELVVRISEFREVRCAGAVHYCYVLPCVTLGL
jgi:hypothetical protein